MLDIFQYDTTRIDALDARSLSALVSAVLHDGSFSILSPKGGCW